MANEVQITLGKELFSPGDIVTGQIVCNFTSARKIRAVHIRFTGKCTTSWTEEERYYDDFFKEDRTRSIDYSGEETYFDQKYDLAGEQTITPERTTYNFSYQLPDHLPSSYNGCYDWGQVLYTVTATIENPWQFDSKAVARLAVLSPLNLNFVPRIKEPVEISVDKELCSCWCNNSGPLTFTFSLPSTGYIPGQDVRIGVHVENLTNTNVEQVKFKITELTEFHATTPSISYKYNKEVIANYNSGRIGAHGDKSWTAELTIPKERYFPNLVPCNLIFMNYELKGEVVLPMPHTNLKAVVPLTIGNVQFTGGSVDVVLGPPREVPTAPLIAVPGYGNTMNYNTMYPTAPLDDNAAELPPSYEEVQKK